MNVDSNLVEARTEALEAALQDPEVREAFDAVLDGVKRGEITWAQVGGFGENELEGAYQSAIAMIEGKKPAKAIKIAGLLIFIDPNKSRYYRLVGLALQHLAQYSLADSYYQIALSIDPDDAVSQLYRGEVLLQLGKTALGSDYIREGLTAADADPELHAIAKRARAIVRAFGTTEEHATTPS